MVAAGCSVRLGVGSNPAGDLISPNLFEHFAPRSVGPGQREMCHWAWPVWAGFAEHSPGGLKSLFLFLFELFFLFIQSNSNAQILLPTV